MIVLVIFVFTQSKTQPTQQRLSLSTRATVTRGLWVMLFRMWSPYVRPLCERASGEREWAIEVSYLQCWWGLQLVTITHLLKSPSLNSWRNQNINNRGSFSFLNLISKTFSTGLSLSVMVQPYRQILNKKESTVGRSQTCPLRPRSLSWADTWRTDVPIWAPSVTEAS